MATTNQIKFYKSANQPTGAAIGSIWFSTSDRTIRVYTGTDWEKYAGLVNAQWNGTDKLLTITSANGTTTTLDLSDMASASGVASQIQTINTNVSNAQSAADAAQADVDAVEEKLGDGFSKDSTVTAQLAAVKATADAAAVKATVDAELANKADATQVATDISTAIADEVTRADGAYDPKGSASAAQAAAIAKAEELDGATNDRIDTIDSEYKAADEAILGQIEGIVAASVSVKNADGDKYVVVTKAEDKNEYTIASKGIDDAIKVESDRAAAAEQGLGARIDALDAAETGRVSVLEKQVAALNAATHFEGKVEGDTFEAAIAASGKTFEAGDIVIYGNKEYIFDGTAWIELGDTTAESNRITSLEGLVGTTSVDSQIDAKIEALDATVGEASVAEGKHVAVQVVEVDGVLTTLTVSEKDIASAAKLLEIEGEVDLNTEAVADHKTRIKALEATSGGLGTTYVKVSDYNTDKAAFEQKHTDLQGEIDAAEGRLDTAEADIDGVQGDVANLQAGTGLADGASAPVYADSNYLGSATTLVEADKALDAKIKEVADSVTSKNVSAEGDAYVSATAANNKVTVATVTGTVESKSGLATNQGVYDALCWVEFE